MSRRRGGIVVAVLVVLAVGLVALALRPRSVPQAPKLIPTAGAIAMSGQHIWAWTGPDQCSGAPASSIEHFNGSAWTSHPVPLAVVEALTFSGPRFGVAIGQLPDCRPQTLLTPDGGSTWQVLTNAVPLADGWLTGLTLWGVATQPGEHAIRRYQLSPIGASREGVQPTNPCASGIGAPTQIAAPASDTALLLCQTPQLDERQVDRTQSAGARWEIVVDQRPQTGFDGSGVDVVQLATVGARHAWALFVDSTGECPEGQVRRSVDGGLTWVRLTCPSQTASLNVAFSLDFATTRAGALIGLASDQPTVLLTHDGGQSWQAMSVPIPS